MQNKIQIILEEPENFFDFFPFSEMHCIWEIRCGILRLFEKIQTLFPENNLIFKGRKNHINSFLKRENLQNKVEKDLPTLSIFANFIIDKNISDQIKNAINSSENKNFNLIFVDENENFVATFFDNFNSKNSNLTSKKIKLNGIKKINYLWEVLDFQGEQIIEDKNLIAEKLEKNRNKSQSFENVILINQDEIFVEKNVKIAAGAILDATNGAIIVGENAKIMHNSVIIGPCFIGKNSVVKIGAKIYENCSFGESCKIGGEIENSIFHSFSNKQHDGFLGHSYICEWVNLGANTNNSDLKNNYSNVKMNLPHKQILTEKQFLGLMIGDHSKTAINSAFSTGTIIGTSSMITTCDFPSKLIPSLKWIINHNFEDYLIEKAIETARKVMQRRDKILTEEEIILLKEIVNR
jgi:UDP-N-acetylglucosamine diphosphorylase/glucosamine-1-phosphate N-acetyltransferase